MLWLIIISASLVLAVAISLWASFDSRRDISTGTPRFDSVADVTGIWNRETLDRILGPRDSEDRYRATAEEIRKIPRRPWKLWLDSEVADIVCMVAAVSAPFLYITNVAGAIVLLSCSGVYVLLGYVWAAREVFRGRGRSEDGQPT